MLSMMTHDVIYGMQTNYQDFLLNCGKRRIPQSTEQGQVRRYSHLEIIIVMHS